MWIDNFIFYLSIHLDLLDLLVICYIPIYLSTVYIGFPYSYSYLINFN